MEERLSPICDVAAKEDQPEAIGLRKREPIDLTVKDNELLAKESIFGDKLGPTSCQVTSGTENHRMARRSGEMEKVCFE